MCIIRGHTLFMQSIVSNQYRASLSVPINGYLATSRYEVLTIHRSAELRQRKQEAENEIAAFKREKMLDMLQEQEKKKAVSYSPLEDVSICLPANQPTSQPACQPANQPTSQPASIASTLHPLS